MKQLYYSLLLAAFVLFGLPLAAQNNNVGIGTTTPDPSAMLDITATGKGVLVPRMTTAQRNAIASPATGLMVYDTDLGCFYYFNASQWISLCQAGPQGPAGPTGAAGANGAPGVTGPQGVAGVTGATGAAGANGATGAQGPTGNDGVTGPQGATGADGATGPQGATGVAGANGATGAQGPTGAAGTNGATGPTGPQGAQGIQGVTGPQGAQGVQGPQGNQGVQGNQGLQGIQGIQGPTGPSWQNFQVNQTSAISVDPANFPNFTPLTGLSQTITLNSPAKILVLTDGGIQTSSTLSTGFSLVDVVVTLNGALMPDGGFKRLNAINSSSLTGAFAFWSMGVYAATSSGFYTLPAGTYTIAVQARGNGGSVATVGGDNTTVLQGVMQIFIIQ